MKKNVLSLSIASALLGLGLAGGAHAISVTTALGSATSAAIAGNGVGHSLVVPYFTANQDNKTQINIVNTDLVNGKAVKVRFRSAANSDDVADFQVFLSPGDVWSAEVSRDAASGQAMISTGDTTCTKPALRTATLAQRLFKTDRLDNTSASATAATRAAATREGYVEILTMADVRPIAYTATNSGAFIAVPVAGAVPASSWQSGGAETVSATNAANPLFTAIKHGANGAAPACSGAAWTAIDDNANVADLSKAAAAGLARPTGLITANWTILNTVTSSVFGGAATAIALTGPQVAAGNVLVPAADQSGDPVKTGALANTGNLTYWPQSTIWGSPTSAEVGGQTADPLLRGALPIVFPTSVDLPDMSTPFLGGGGTTAGNNTLAQNIGAADASMGPVNTANQVAALLARTSVSNEYITGSGINAATDWTFSMPTRRYGVVFNYLDGKAYFNTGAGAITTTGTGSNYFQPGNAVVNASRRMVCVINVQPVAMSREEETAGSTIMSPAAAPSLCGEVSTLSVNNAASLTSNSLLAVATLNDIDATYAAGWLTMKTPGTGAGGVGLPILGHSYVRANTGTLNIGAAYPHR